MHNVGDALTAVPLWIAFSYARRPPTKRYTYGFGRIEDLAGIAVVLTILFSALFAGYESVLRIVHPQTITHLGAVAAAASSASSATRRSPSCASVPAGASAAWPSWPTGSTRASTASPASPCWPARSASGSASRSPTRSSGSLIALAIMRIVWQSARSVLSRAIDGVDPEVVDEIHEALAQTPGVVEVTETRVRWLGHRMLAEVNVAVPSGLSVEDGHAVAVEVRHRLLHRLEYLSDATVHVDPDTASGQAYHRIPSIGTTTCRRTPTRRAAQLEGSSARPACRLARARPPQRTVSVVRGSPRRTLLATYDRARGSRHVSAQMRRVRP